MIDYKDFFDKIVNRAGEIPVRRRIVGQMVALTAAFRQDDGTFALRFISGNEFDVPIFFNDRTGQEEPVDVDGGLFVVGTWVIVNPDSRMVAVESKRPGVGSMLIERYLQMEGREFGYDDLSIDLNQASTDGFDTAVRELDTIKKVSVTVKQPNFDWSDGHNAIHDYAEQSGADSATVEMRAPRGEGLSVSRGIVHDILGLARQRISSLRNVIVTGSEAGEAGDKTINLNRFQRKTSVRVKRGATPMEELDALAPAAEALTSESDDSDSS
ncbi:hypothetical protein [uncultured Microbacterium sp.]|uniref:hypothetical protein n=1 Tax=uncultured Microbacterium sp. TaxID=191216 RepID=UPI0028D07DA5|nr:hypothetical protein [uncultured Microbacterium sp.]